MQESKYCNHKTQARTPKIKIVAALICHVWRRFRGPGHLPPAGSDLTGGAALPMFPAAARRRDLVETPEKANKSLG
jgi:hypothetical protein